MLGAIEEFGNLIMPDLRPAERVQIDGILQDMLTQSELLLPHRRLLPIDPASGNFVLGTTTNFRPFSRNGNLCIRASTSTLRETD